jgi:MFS family permease
MTSDVAVRGRSGSAAGAWRRPGLAMVAIGWGANQFAPLIVLYQRDGVAASATGIMFGLYAVGLVPALLVGGRWSDRVGRYPVVRAALLVSVVATVVLMCGSAQTWWLYPGRFLAGLSSGLAFGTGAAWIRELSVSAGGLSAGPRRATVAMTAGFGGGPLVAGLVAQWVAWPGTTAYLPHLVLALAALVALRRTPDRRANRDSRGTVGAAPTTPLARHVIMVMLPFAPWVFGTAAIALAYLPAMVADSAGNARLVFAAITTALPALVGVLVQPVAVWAASARGPWLLLVAMGSVVAGLVVALWAAQSRALVPVVLACVVLGAAYGLTQFAGLSDVQRVADPTRLGIATAVYQALSYLGFALPYLLTLARSSLGWPPTRGLLVLLAAAVAATAWLLATGGIRGRQR